MDKEPCWKSIGVWAPDGASCPMLKDLVHCRNCEVFAAHGRSLLDREAPAGYLEEWLEHLAKERESAPGDTESVLIFRLEDEWLAMPTTAFKGVHPVCKVHRMPHRSDEVFLGLANLGGMLELCFSLKALFGMKGVVDPSRNAKPRLLSIERDAQRWVFEVDEIAGIARRQIKDSSNVPVTVANASANFTKCVFQHEGRTVGLLEDELLICALKRRIS